MAMDANPRTYRFLPADILTSGYRVVGKVMVSTTGVMGLMNDPTHSYSKFMMRGWRACTCPPSWWIILNGAHDEVAYLCRLHGPPRRPRPQALVRGGYASVVEYPARITTQMFEIEGTLEMPGRFDFAVLISEGTRDFIPLFNATLTGILLPNLRVEGAGC